MQISYSTIMTWMVNLKSGLWEIKRSPKNYSEDDIITKFNDLFKNELVREASYKVGFNPYKGIGYISVYLKDDKERFEIIDDYGYVSCFYEGIYKRKGKKKLCLNTKAHGFNANYFKFLDKENDEYVSVESIIEGKRVGNPNIRRLINIMFMRLQPYWETFDKEQISFADYTDEEKLEIKDLCRKCKGANKDEKD